jgi:hypothetical protein
VNAEKEGKADQLTDAFLAFTNHLVVFPWEVHQQGVPESLGRMLSRPGKGVQTMHTMLEEKWSLKPSRSVDTLSIR